MTDIRQDLFTYTLNILRRGKTQSELSEKLNECVQRTQDTGKMATLTITLKIKPDGNQVFIEDQIKTKLPEFERQKTLFFATDDGNLQRDDPRQEQLPFETKSIQTKSA